MTKAAKSDLKEIHDFIAADSAESALRFITRLLTQMKHIAEIGVEGVSRDHIRPGLRMHPLGRYVLYFRIQQKRLIVVRIVRGSRDLELLDFRS